MSNGKVHIVAGFVLVAAMIYFFRGFFDFPTSYLPIVGIIVYIFSRIPDIDHESSSITWQFLSIGVVLVLYGLGVQNVPELTFLPQVNTFIFGVGLLTVTILLALAKHRGFTHTLWFVGVASLLIFLIPDISFKVPLVAVAAIAGYSHLLMDGYLLKI